MLRITFIFYLAVLNFSSLRANGDIHVIEITYQVFVENLDSLSSYKYKLPYESVHIVSPDKVLTLNKYAADVDEIHLYYLNELLDFQLFLKDAGQPVAVKNRMQQIPTLVTNSIDERVYQIAGMLCKRYEIIYKNTTVEIYTTDSFGVNFSPFTQVSGYAMQYTFIDEVYGRVTYQAKSIFPTMATKQTFSIDDYNVRTEVFPEDLRSQFDEDIIVKESTSLFKLNRKKISYKFKLRNREKIDDKMDADKLVVFIVGGTHKYNAMEKDLLSGLLDFGKNKDVRFYFFALKSDYTKKEMMQLEEIGLEVAYLRDVILSKYKVEYYPTYILLDRDRRVVKYKIGTSAEMLSSFSNKISALDRD